MKRKILYLTIIAISSKIFGFLREILMSYYYGASEYSDIYLFSTSMASIFLGWLSTFSVIHTPIYQELKHTKSIKQAERFSNQILFIEILVGFLALIIIWVGGNIIVKTIGKDFSSERIYLTSVFLKWSALSVLLSSLSLTMISELNCGEKIIKANATNIVISTVQIILIVNAVKQDNFLLLRYAAPISSLIQLVILFCMLFRDGRETVVRMPFMAEIKQFFVLIVPVFLSAMMDDINAFVDKAFGARLEAGSISSLNYAHLLKQLCFYIFATALVTIIYPKISENIAKKDYRSAEKNIYNGINSMIIIFTFIVIFICFHSTLIVKLVYERGAFDHRDVIVTSECLIMYCSALLPLAIREILVRTFQAFQDTKINLYIGCLSTIVNVGLNFLLYKKYQHIGLALSTSIAAYISVPILLCLLRRKLNGFDLKTVYITIGKCFLAAGISCGSIYFLMPKSEITDMAVVESIATLTIAFIFGIILYSFLLKYLRLNLQIKYH